MVDSVAVAQEVPRKTIVHELEEPALVGLVVWRLHVDQGLDAHRIIGAAAGKSEARSR